MRRFTLALAAACAALLLSGCFLRPCTWRPPGCGAPANHPEPPDRPPHDLGTDSTKKDTTLTK